MKIRKYSRICADWALDTFGPKVFYLREERAHRFLEEALELCQAVGTTKEEALMLVDYVYSRDKGDLVQEIGGVSVTLAVLCESFGVDLQEAAKKELERILDPAVQSRIRAKQAAKPDSGPLPGPTPPNPTLGDLVYTISESGIKTSIPPAGEEEILHPQAPVEIPSIEFQIDPKAFVCFNCRNFKHDEPPAGRMPGVGSHHRKCMRKRIDTSGPVEWRNPTDWCDQFISVNK